MFIKNKRKKRRRRRTTRGTFIVTIALIVGALIFRLFDGENENGPISTPAATTPALSPLAGNEIRVHYIDVGHADAILIQSANNAVLIDGGEYATKDALTRYLRGAGVTALDYVIATHPHSDHIGGLAPVIRQFKVRNVVMPDATNNTATFEHLLTAIEKKGLSVTVPSVGDTITAGIITLIALAPGKNFKDLNNASITVRMVHGETAFLFTGDAESVSEREMLKTRLNLQANVLKAGHHGSRTSTSVEFLDAIRPDIVIVTCGRDNSYGHPNMEFLKVVKHPKRNITLYRTDELGTIVLTTDGHEVKTYFTGKKGGEPSAG